MDIEQLGRTIIRVFLHTKDMPTSGPVTFVGAAVKAGRAMDFAARIRRRKDLDHRKIIEFAHFCQLDQFDLIFVVLPQLKDAGVLDFSTSGEQVSHIEEFVNVSAPLLHQTATVWNLYMPTDEERCAMESADLASHAPLAESDHHGALETMGFNDAVRKRALDALDALQLIKRARSQKVGEPIIYNADVWGRRAEDVARFLKSLPGDERSVLTELSGKAMHHPGIPMSHLSTEIAGDMLRTAQKVGFLDAPRVVTMDKREQQFVFSPTLEQELAKKNSTDALHERKLFVAHILFGHHFSHSWSGRIQDPVVLVKALLRQGEVGPATAIRSDYPLLESYGIVEVVPSPHLPGRASLKLVKEDVVQDGLELLEAAMDQGVAGNNEAGLSNLWLPGTFVAPETERKRIDLREGPAKELFDSGIEALREEAAKEVRGEKW